VEAAEQAMQPTILRLLQVHLVGTLLIIFCGHLLSLGAQEAVQVLEELDLLIQLDL
jgi:hypothetical protein